LAESAHILPGLRLRSHRFQLPLDYARSDGETIEVFAREVWAPDREGQQLPWLVFFQGGPGFGAPRPMGPNGWIGRALRDFRVLLLDQRGCGLSSPVTAQTLAALGDAQRQAAWLSHFRADNIVRDAEAIRRQLIGDEPWSVLGQSFGGFCAMNYLSSAPEGLREVLITGGIPPLTRTTDDIYRATYPRVRAKNLRYYARYPEDRQRVRDIVAHLLDHEVTMPRGGRLTPERFLQLGIAFGASDGFEAVHYLLEEAFVDIGGARHLNANFLLGIEEAQAFAAVSSGDNSNIVAARVAREKFNVERVVARIYDPRRAAIYARLGIPTVATVAWTTEQMMRHLLPGDPAQLWTDETGAAVMHRVDLNRTWYGRRAEELTFGLPSRVAMIYREGGVIVPTADSVLQEGDEPILLSAKEALDEVNEHCAARAVDPE